MPLPQLESLFQQRDQLKSQLQTFGDMRSGSLVERYRKCGKANCHCARKGAQGHGPSFSLTRAVGGKTLTKIIPAEAVEQTRIQIAEYHKFRQLIGQLVRVCEQICDLQLRAEPQQVARKKNAARRRASY